MSGAPMKVMSHSVSVISFHALSMRPQAGEPQPSKALQAALKHTICSRSRSLTEKCHHVTSTQNGRREDE